MGGVEVLKGPKVVILISGGLTDSIWWETEETKVEVVEISPPTGIKVVLSRMEGVVEVTSDSSSFLVLLSGEDVEDTRISGVGVVVLEIKVVILLPTEAVKGTVLAGELAVIDLGVIAPGEVAKYFVVIEC